MYLSTRTSRYINANKIEEICNKYWGNDLVIKEDRNKNLDTPKNIKNTTFSKIEEPIVIKKVTKIAYVKMKDGELKSFVVNKISLKSNTHLLLYDGRRIYRFKFKFKKMSISLAFDCAEKGIPMIGIIGTVAPKEYCKLYFSNG